MKAWDYRVVVFDGNYYCVECLEELEDSTPVFASDEVDVYPVCSACHEEHDYMGLTSWGLEHRKEEEKEEL